jgi:hypothetical protein
VRSTNGISSLSVLDTSPVHVRLLGQLLVVTPYLLLPDNPLLWHTDLHGGNIMIKAEGTPDITNIIDWQEISVAPLFLQYVFAEFAEHTGDDHIVRTSGITIPELPPDFD